MVAGVGGSGLLEVRVGEIELGGVVEGLAGGFAEEGVGGLVGPLFLGGEDLGFGGGEDAIEAAEDGHGAFPRGSSSFPVCPKFGEALHKRGGVRFHSIRSAVLEGERLKSISGVGSLDNAVTKRGRR